MLPIIKNKRLQIQAKIHIHIEPNLSCAEDGSYFEPLSDNYLVHFTRLMEVYQSKSEEDSHD